MPHLSQTRLSKHIEKELILVLEQVLTDLKKQDEMRLFLASFLTDTEKLMLAKRFAIIILLGEGIPDAQIARILHVTRVTVSKMRSLTEKRETGFSLALKRIQGQKEFLQLRKILFSLASYRAHH